MIDEEGNEIDDDLWAEMAEAYAQGFCPVYGGVKESDVNETAAVNITTAVDKTDITDFPDDIPF